MSLTCSSNFGAFHHAIYRVSICLSDRMHKHFLGSISALWFEKNVPHTKWGNLIWTKVLEVMRIILILIIDALKAKGFDAHMRILNRGHPSRVQKHHQFYKTPLPLSPLVGGVLCKISWCHWIRNGCSRFKICMWAPFPFEYVPCFETF